jgi:N utilization substance protein B
VAARSKARKRALDVLYESDLRSTNPLSTLAERVALAEPPVNDYTVELVEGVQGNRDRIDAILSDYAEGWTVARMPDVDRAILRLAVYELLWRDEVPDAVAIDEAVELAKTLSTDESPRFVNGVLARVLKDRDHLLEAPTGPLTTRYGALSTITDSGASTCHRTRRSVSASTLVSYMSASVPRSSWRTGMLWLPTSPRWRWIAAAKRRRMSAFVSSSAATRSRLSTMRASGGVLFEPVNTPPSGGSRSLTATP